MITKVTINNNHKTPISWLSSLNNFNNKRYFEFKPGINIIVGKNGCGKSTLLKLIEKYTLVSYHQCNIINQRELFDYEKEFLDGVDVYGDYIYNIFRLVHPDELTSTTGSEYAMSSFENFGTLFNIMHSSTGNGVLVSMNSLFNIMFNKKANLKFPEYSKLKKEYKEYIDNHKVDCEKEFTILMDEPDRNLDIENIEQIKSILSYHKENTQVIAVIHNPLLIYILSNNPTINIIEMTKGYVNGVKNKINKLINKNDD